MNNDNSHNDKDTFLANWLDGKLSDTQLKNLVSETDFLAYMKLRKGLDTIEALDGSIDNSFQNIQKYISKQNTSVKPNYTNWLLAIAASILLLFGLFNSLNTNDIVIETGYGETKTIALLDGSEVLLNSKSQLSYSEDLWKTKRVLNLDGEAYFKVAKGETFTVNTTNGDVTVLGTQFNVISKNDFFDVVCYEGKVSVKTMISEHVLLPKDAVRIVDGYQPQQSKQLLNTPTWIHGESTFKSVALRYVITALEDQYNVSFDTKHIDDTDLYTGSFPNNDFNIALKAVFKTLNISYEEKEKRNIKLRYNE